MAEDDKPALGAFRAFSVGVPDECDTAAFIADMAKIDHIYEHTGIANAFLYLLLTAFVVHAKMHSAPGLERSKLKRYMDKAFGQIWERVKPVDNVQDAPETKQ